MHRFQERRILKTVSALRFFDIVRDVASYHKFVPYVSKSEVYDSNGDQFKGKLEVSFAGARQSYTSNVQTSKLSDSKYKFQAVASGSTTFDVLESEWNIRSISDGGCMVVFDIKYKFRSSLQGRLADTFFTQTQKQMVDAFVKRASHSRV